MCFVYDDYSKVWNEDILKARKRKRCCECGSFIQPGQQYQRIKSLYDGSWSLFNSCLPCVAVRAMVYDAERARGCDHMESQPPVGFLGESISEDDDHYGLYRRDRENDEYHVCQAAAHLFPEATILNPS